MIKATNLGFPRIGAHRELKRALESFWAGESSEADLLAAGRALRRAHWTLQRDLGLDHIPSNDFSFYDHVLDTAVMVGAVPERFHVKDGQVDLNTYFALARGAQEKAVDVQGGENTGVPAMEMTKWFDTNYHYIVPELAAGQTFRLASTQAVDLFEEAFALSIHTRPVLLGPVSFLLLSKMVDEGNDTLSLLGALLPVYEDMLWRLEQAGADWVQIDEPFLALDLNTKQQNAFREAYSRLGQATGLRLLVATYFEGLRDNTELAFGLPVAAIHLDLVRDSDGLVAALDRIPDAMSLSLGVVDGRNVWRADLDRLAATVQTAVARLGEDRVMVAPSCSLLHVPVDLGTEPDLDPEVAPWLAFARQKIEEVVALAQGGPEPVFEASRRAAAQRRTSTRTYDDTVRGRVAAIDEAMFTRPNTYASRQAVQQEHLALPLLPTTTIGSFPQTNEIRQARAGFRKGDIGEADYEAFIEREIEQTIRRQETIGLDVLVHGEAERTDMVEYFGQQLRGFLFTRNGWVQSYGSRCVRPPVIYGDVSRPAPMTVHWATFAQSLTDRPVKGMLTGPVTILQWSFVRDDQPRSQTCLQIALAIRDEVRDLEQAGIRIIQIDEPALREGLPLRHSDWRTYLDWAVACFRLATSGVNDATQIHTHMCYAEFNDIIEPIADMDADVISIESSRSRMELLEAFERSGYPNEIGPGVYDIHSPRIPDKEEIEDLIGRALGVLKAGQLWVNPDCGLKTRRWVEAEPALRNMVEAARSVRERLTEPVPA
jgi:5-methyltetrahydropteroyltriglutamate--homocysteine methyltransferase